MLASMSDNIVVKKVVQNRKMALAGTLAWWQRWGGSYAYKAGPIYAIWNSKIKKNLNAQWYQNESLNDGKKNSRLKKVKFCAHNAMLIKKFRILSVL